MLFYEYIGFEVIGERDDRLMLGNGQVSILFDFECPVRMIPEQLQVAANQEVNIDSIKLT